MLMSREELENAARVHPQIAQALARRPKPQQPPSDRIKEMRRFMAEMDKAISVRIGPTPNHTTELYHSICMRDGYMSSIKIYKPSLGLPGPLIALCFAGAFMAGTNDQLSNIARALTQIFGATAVNISYRLAPEFKFPVAQHDGIDSLRWIAEHATSDLLNADPSKGFVLGGVSAGGNLTACLSRIFQSEPLAHPLTGQWLSAANLMDNARVPQKYKTHFISREQNAHAPMPGAEGVPKGKNPAEPDPESDLRWPLNSNSSFSGQPRTYFQCCGMDIFRDDSLIYDELLREAGVPTRFDFYPGCPHAFWYLIIGSEIANKALVDIVHGFGWLLETEVSDSEVAEALIL